jgi:lauroyl/myristoyl acyltransferase
MPKKQPIIWAALSSFIKIIRVLSHEKACELGSALGALVAFFSGSRVKKATERCAIALGIQENKASRIVRASYRHFGIDVVEFARLPQMLNRIDELVKVHGENNLEEAIGNGNGVILITAHIGNWEYAAAWLAQHGYQINTLGADQRDERITDLIKNIRISYGAKALGKSSDLKKMIQALSLNEIIAIPIDQDAKLSGVLSPFLGHPASTPTGVFKLAGRFGCAIVPAFCIRNSDKIKYDLFILPAMQGRNGSQYGKDLQQDVDDCNDVISEWIMKYPEQWLWLYPRWESVEMGMFK